MPTVVFIEDGGAEHRIQADVGQSVMQAAVGAMVPGIVADCGGACACATCHGYVDEEWVERVPPAQSDEVDMIDGGCLHTRLTSRLTCQIKVTEELDGLTIRLPPSQN